jgi:diaminobutyrate-2-oxoglutarate transaminase
MRSCANANRAAWLAQLARDLKRYCFEHGLIVERGGRHGAVLGLLPPLTVSRAESDEALDVIASGLAVL